MYNLINKLIYILACLAFMLPQAEAQTLKAFLKAADEAIVDKDFYNAMYYYQEAVKFDTSDIAVKYMYGESAKTFNAFSVAENQFLYVTENDSENNYPLATYHLAQVQQNMGKYEEAKRNYELFLSESNDDQENYKEKADKEIAAIEWAMANQDNPEQGVTIEHLDSSVNTPFSDFGAIEKDDNLYYSSLRFNYADENYPNRLYSKILTQNDSDFSSSASEDDIEIQEEPNKRKSKASTEKVYEHEAHTSFNRDYTKMYYTICNYENSLDIRCDLYVKKLTEKGTYGNAKKLPSSINDITHTSTQPNIAYNSATDEERLYFVSNREGGEGGMDIWYTIVKGDDYSAPTNLSSINSSDDEVTPYFHNATNTLYFSSDGYLGMGGHDIYKSRLVGNEYSDPENLKAPTNTSFNDLYYTLNEEGTKAYFSSNRTGSLFLEDSFEACCYDIYRADIEEIMVELDALTFDGLSQEELLDANVRIYDPVTNELLFEKLNPLANDHKFMLKCGREYTIITDRPGYESDTTTINLKECDKEIIKKIYLNPIEGKLDVLTLLAPGEAALNGAIVTLYDLSDPAKEPIIISQPNGNLFSYDIVGGRKYKIVAGKSGYETQEIEFEAIDFIDGVITKKVIFEKEIINLNEYLPVAVYFDNDRPDKRTRKLHTAKSYTDTYYPYIAKKEEFKTQRTLNMSGDQKAIATSSLDNFFEIDVKGGYSRMNLFFDKLSERLNAGESIELSLKGFASPRAANKYNLALGQRRIWTIKNELIQYAGGKLLPYIDNGTLKVIEISYGEEAAPRDVSDSYNNRKLSVYSVEASRQRKAEIVRVRVLN